MRKSIEITLTLALLAAAGPTLAADPPAAGTKAAAPADTVAPREPATGMASGKRQHAPIVFTKTLDAAADGKPNAASEATSRRTSEDCDDADPAAAASPTARASSSSESAPVQPKPAQAGKDRSRCVPQNPLHQDEPVHGTHPLHEGKKD